MRKIALQRIFPTVEGLLAFAAILLYFLPFSSSARGAEGDVVFANFDGDDYGSWKVEGEAFGTKPARGSLPSQMNVSGFIGAGLVNSYSGGDGSTGTLTSPVFTIEKPYINFLIGGGGVPGLSFELVVDGEVVRNATGSNTEPGGSEELDWDSWDATEFIGKSAFFRIVDSAVGGWGHLNVDEITFSDERRHGREDNVREVIITARYLQFAIKQTERKHWVRVEVDGKVAREFEASLALVSDQLGSEDFEACVDMRDWLGKKCLFIVEKSDSDAEYATLRFTDELFGGVKAYDEKYRPQFHFSPRYGWTNDPNGLVYYDGVYHLFYQHNPFGVNWGNMTWGHATSPDLLHWTEQGDAIYPDRLGSIFSGSGAVDFNNTTGFQRDSKYPPLVFMYTANGPSMRYGEPVSQALAYSLDGGKTFLKYEGNPTIPHIVGGNRDPKIFWHEPTQKWIAALYMDGEDYALFGSKDLKTWKLLCSIEKLGCSECPDLFELPVDGDENNKLWVFWGGNGKYLLGNFDGEKFERLSEPLDAKYGGNDYAAQTFSNASGRRIQFSWMNGGRYPGMPFNQQFTAPRELSLVSTSDGVRLRVNPVAEIATLRGNELNLKRVQDAANPTRVDFYPVDGDSRRFNLLDCEVEFEPDGANAAVEVLGRRIEFDTVANTATYEGVTAPLIDGCGRIKLRLLLDATSLEIFFNDGTSQIAKCFVPDDDVDAPILRAEHCKSIDVKCWPMSSVWN